MFSDSCNVEATNARERKRKGNAQRCRLLLFQILSPMPSICYDIFRCNAVILVFRTCCCCPKPELWKVPFEVAGNQVTCCACRSLGMSCLQSSAPICLASVETIFTAKSTAAASGDCIKAPTETKMQFTCLLPSSDDPMRLCETGCD